MLLAIFAASLVWLPAVGLLSLLALPVAGIFRMAVLIQRGASVGFADFWTGMRRFAVPAMMLGLAATLVAVVLAANIVIGLSAGDILGGVFATLALYGLVGLAMYLLAAWPIVVDPVREELSLRSRLRLAFYVCVTRAGRMIGLTLVLGVVVAFSTVLFAALLTITIAYVALVASRYVLPAADRLEGRPTVPVVS